jgi:catechol 2,3-dioxygenase-like lactoylglutathione lyase family enzyme
LSERIVPMIHVSDVRATADWYTSIGFTLVRYNEEDGEMNWALLLLGSSELMLQAGGKPSTAHRREVDLYVHTDNVARVHARLNGRVQVVEDLHDTFYGMREFIIRDCNGFWITFGQPKAE